LNKAKGGRHETDEFAMYQQSLQNSILPSRVLGLSFTAVFSVLVTNPVSPGIFGHVFQAHRASLVQVETANSPMKFSSGFIIGGRGEFLFGLKAKPDLAPIRVRTSTGGWVYADLITHNEQLKLGLGRIRGFRPGRFVPLELGLQTQLKPENWLVTMSHDEEGQPEPFAGTFRGFSQDRKKNTYLKLDIPGKLGSPVLSLKGKLVGVIFQEGRRKTKAWPIKAVTTFLQGIQFGR